MLGGGDGAGRRRGDRSRASERLAPLIDLPSMERVDRRGGRSRANPRRRARRNFGAVLTGTLDKPRLIGTEERIERWKGEVALAAAAAKGSGSSYPEVAVQPVATSGASKKSARVRTATGALTLLFLLTMLLAGMVMSNLVEEKANKIIEVLAAAIPMDAVFLGKLVAMLAVSMVGIAVWGGIAGVVLSRAGAGSDRCPPRGRLAAVRRAVPGLFRDGLPADRVDLPDHRRDGADGARRADAVDAGDDAAAGRVLPRDYATSDLGSPVEIGAIAFPLSSPYAMVSRAAQEPRCGRTSPRSRGRRCG